MNTHNAYGYSIFCDDIREEVGSKLSFMGIYNGSLQVISSGPVNLPKLCISLTLVVPGGTEINDIAFVIQQEIDGQVEDIFTAVQSDIPKVAVTPERIAKIGMNINLSPFLIQQSSVLKARARLNGEEVKLGTLQVIMRDAEPNQDGDIEVSGFQSPPLEN